jgi:radical SAM/Cys-rich protein
MSVAAVEDLFARKLREHGLWPLTADRIDTLQVNVGKLCNQACRHCHVDAGPHQTAPEVNMSAETFGHVQRLLATVRVDALDVTGGAPELSPFFRPLVREARLRGVPRVMDRCNLSVLLEPGQADLAAFLAEHRVEVVASLPHYSLGPTDRQRGAGVFDRSIAALQLLNRHGYGQGGGLVLNLVYNPAGAFLPPAQGALEADFKRELDRAFGIRFDALYCITNMPIARYADWLRRSGNHERYMQVLADAFNPRAVPGLMCRNLVSIGPDGTIYDCDFNQQLSLPVAESVPRNIRDFDAAALARRTVVTGSHCLGCTAGAGSSCGGATAG